MAGSMAYGATRSALSLGAGENAYAILIISTGYRAGSAQSRVSMLSAYLDNRANWTA